MFLDLAQSLLVGKVQLITFCRFLGRRSAVLKKENCYVSTRLCDPLDDQQIKTLRKKLQYFCVPERPYFNRQISVQAVEATVWGRISQGVRGSPIAQKDKTKNIFCL